MKIVPLKANDQVYSCRSYLILGDWNHIDDLNTLIDPGTDTFVLKEIDHLSTGVGKVAVEQVILTHNHFDHAGAVMAIKERYNARVLAFSAGPGVDEIIRAGQFIKAGDDLLEVLHTPSHSSDSICLYASSARALFSGDMQLHIPMPGGMYTRDYVDSLQQLVSRDIKTLYSGHNDPVTSGSQAMILQTLHNVRLSEIKPGG